MMTDKPTFIDNSTENNMIEALNRLVGESCIANIENSDNPKIENTFRIATAYFTLSGFRQIIPILSQMTNVKILLGSDPIAEYMRIKRKINQTEQQMLDEKLKSNIKRQELDLRFERDHIPFTRNNFEKLEQLVKFLQTGKIEIRRYEENFLHAKAYIYTTNGVLDSDISKSVIAGSSNLTVSGLTKNLELNLGRYDIETTKKSIIWFDRLWESAIPYDLVTLIENIFKSLSPYMVFLRVLWELYGDEVLLDEESDAGLPLTTFQKHGVVRAMRLIRETGGVIVADEVGLGKTFIAGEIIEYYKSNRQRVLLVCPATVRDTTWSKFLSDHEIFLEVVSFEQLSRDEQLYDFIKRPSAKGKHLKQNIEEYQLIIIDEAHNYRNPNSPTRADTLRALLYGKQKDVLMLTATPVNNSLWDLYYLMKFYLKQDSFFSDRGIISVRERFEYAMRVAPTNLSPDILFPIIDATTVKRTRKFIKSHYPNDVIEIDGKRQSIIFPKPNAISVRYNIDSLNPELFNLIGLYLDPDSSECLKFVRYATDFYLKNIQKGDQYDSASVTGFLLSGLLKRFESSALAFRKSLGRLIEKYDNFVSGLEQGVVLSSKVIQDLSLSEDEELFNEVIETLSEDYSIEKYRIEELRSDTRQDIQKLKELKTTLDCITIDNDPKLIALVQELERIVSDANQEYGSKQDQINKRKVIIFTYFSDTVIWIKEFIDKELVRNSKLETYKGRIAAISGSLSNDADDRVNIAAKLAPLTAGRGNEVNEIDILITTDILAEGVNLQQVRHVINFDLPWNPMRLVQRHGRIDRIGSPHNEVYLRTIFPENRINDLLGLEERIAKKITMAAASIGVLSPLSEVKSKNRIFTESREEIEKLLSEDPTLFEIGGTRSSSQSGEEYRQILRKALMDRKDEIENIPWKSGSKRKSKNFQGVFFCAKIDKLPYLRFVHTDRNWNANQSIIGDSQEESLPWIESELGTCLRIIECGEKEESFEIEVQLRNATYDLWNLARNNIYEQWMFRTDPVNLLPKVRPLNLEVANFIRKNTPSEISIEKLDTVLDILECPWSRRDEAKLREWYNSNLTGLEKSTSLIGNILKSGLEPYIAPEPLPPIVQDDINLIVWMAVYKE